ncbi:conserved hypothetical protein [Teredinibacter turnerae T7901]|uniref:Uncharacterized protein n=1 Tax=Teredinibacter turnerae (strain ATCC 39867 / T7901) TaxID=377629 RepID=C5BJK5_TERTT|nr:hypothetical protein [Teredinibacter turnerae]ACR12048.2 conserved hypothetical protein [Teredinibacter turnerae T7901]
MSKQNRSTLKAFFGDGALPNSSNFRDLIDSTINISEDGFAKDSENGLKLTCHSEYTVLTSFYEAGSKDKAVWRSKFDGDHSNLLWSSQANTDEGFEFSAADDAKLNAALCLARTNNRLGVGIGTKDPKATLDVNGAAFVQERRGTYGRSFESVAANGEWQTIVDNIQGGSGFEIVARAQNISRRRYAMVHAIALHCPWRRKSNDLLAWLGLRNRINYTQVYHDSLLHKIKLRWNEDDMKSGYQLQIRSNCDYGTEQRTEDGYAADEPCVIDFHITRLWDDDDHFQSLRMQAQRGLGDD